MNHREILHHIQFFGALLQLASDTEKPWLCRFVAKLDRLREPVVRGYGLTPDDALADLENQLLALIA